MDTTTHPTHLATVADNPAHDGLLQRIKADLAGSLAPPGRRERLWIGSLLAVVAAGLVAYGYQLVNGLKVTAMREYVSWGVYITNFVFFIGISHYDGVSRAGQVHVGPLVEHRRNDHEDDQNNQHDVHHGCYVDIRSGRCCFL